MSIHAKYKWEFVNFQSVKHKTVTYDPIRRQMDVIVEIELDDELLSLKESLAYLAHQELNANDLSEYVYQVKFVQIHQPLCFWFNQTKLYIGVWHGEF